MDLQVEAEIGTLMTWINHDTGISNSFDYNRCLEMFQRLRATGVPFDPEEIRSKLIARWKFAPEDAVAIKKMAEKVSQGKRIKKR